MTLTRIQYFADMLAALPQLIYSIIFIFLNWFETLESGITTGIGSTVHLIYLGPAFYSFRSIFLAK